MTRGARPALDQVFRACYFRISGYYNARVLTSIPRGCFNRRVPTVRFMRLKPEVEPRMPAVSKNDPPAVGFVSDFVLKFVLTFSVTGTVWDYQ